MMKFFIRFVTMFMPSKKSRHRFRAKWNARLQEREQLKKLSSFGNYHHISAFSKHVIHPKSVLILEINDFHGITLAGYIHYFAELGYTVDCFFHYGQNVCWQPLCRLQDKWMAFIGNERLFGCDGNKYSCRGTIICK